MRWRYSILFLAALLFFGACNRAPGQRAPWATDANQTIIGGMSGSVSSASSGKVMLTITGVGCGVDDDAEAGYLVDVAWVTTEKGVGYARLEYEVSKRNSEVSAVMTNPTVAGEMEDVSSSGTATIFVPLDMVKEPGEQIMVRVVVRGDGDELTSPVAEYEVMELCAAI